MNYRCHFKDFTFSPEFIWTSCPNKIYHCLEYHFYLFFINTTFFNQLLSIFLIFEVMFFFIDITKDNNLVQFCKNLKCQG